MTRLAVIKKSRCFPQKCGNYLCAKVCPVNRQGKDCITEGADQKAAISEKLCIGCGICTKRCPFHAITIINLPETLKESPVHRYGQNAFELFRLPIPQKGQVVGLLGANAIGKTTALEILASLLKPNLGNYTKAPTQKQVIAHFKGTELQGYLEDLFSKELKISYKPQYVDKIPKQIKGKVRKLLEKQASKEKVKEMAEKLDLTRNRGLLKLEAYLKIKLL